MKDNRHFDVIIVGGSYSGLAAAMALGRALKHVLIIDSGNPCNRQTPYSHNFITHDGEKPAEIAALAKKQVLEYKTITFFNGLATDGSKTERGFEILTASGERFQTKKLIFATGVRDLLPPIDGLKECWGISVLHCPFCHGYEVRNHKTGIIGNGEDGYELSKLISNWTNDLTLYTNSKSLLSTEQVSKLEKRNIPIIEKEIAQFQHSDGNLHHILFKDGSTSAITAAYIRSPFEQHCSIIAGLGCQLTQDGYVVVDPFLETTVHGVFACGDNTTRMRSLANAVAMGTMAGAIVTRKLIDEQF